jgi:hypothetical protein
MFTPSATTSDLRHTGRDVRGAVDHAERLIGALLTPARPRREWHCKGKGGEDVSYWPLLPRPQVQ